MDERVSRDPRALAQPSQTRAGGEACVVSYRRGQNPRKEGRKVFR
jgi:hypothetical protein